ncbi:MAG TPA: hypothetical protein VEU78_02310 [Steroidobacteraceae bacterium]|nr:hypothetical protein [Steroidobacteraceae bacterium]
MSRPVTLSWIAVLLAAALVGAAARAATSWAGTLATRALNEGPASQLPPHLTAVLRLSRDGQGLAVHQLVVRDGFTVRTFNVGAQAPHPVVMMVADEAAKLTVAYLLTPHGHLGRALRYHAGEAPQELPAAAAKSGFAAEVRFWSGVAGAGAGAAAH